MKRIYLLSLLFTLLFSCQAFAYPVNGVIALYDDSRDIIVVETTLGYSVMEMVSLRMISQDDQVVGELHSLGYHDMYDKTTGQNVRVCIDDFGLSEREVLDWIKDHL